MLLCFRITPISYGERMPQRALRLGELTAETPQDPSGLVTLFIQRRRPECLAANFIRKLVNWCTKLVCPSPGHVKTLLAALLRPVP